MPEVIFNGPEGRLEGRARWDGGVSQGVRHVRALRQWLA